MSRYSVDYSHWSDSKYVPDDEATREEIEERRRTEKERNSAQFEKANRGFCEQFKRDAKEREERRREKEDEARALRLKGNVRYKKGNYEGALGVYLRALAAEPYSLPVLSNLSLTCSKLGWWDDSLEYSDRAVHVSRGGRNGIADGPDRAAARAKALYRRAAANAALGRRGDALRDLDACLALDPRNEEAAGRRAAALRDAEEERAEERVRDAMKMILGTSGEPPRCGEGASPGLSEAVIGPASAADAEAYVERDPTLLYQKVMKCVMCGDGDSDGAALRNICGAIDSIMEELRRGGPGARLSCIPSLGDGIARNADAFQSVPAGLRLADNTAAAGATPADLLCLILRLRPLARAYLRTSGYLAQLCQDAAGSDEGAAKAVRPSNDKAVRPSNDEAGGYEFSMDRCLRYHILAEAIQDEGRSRDVLAEHEVLSAAIASASLKCKELSGETGCGDSAAALGLCLSTLSLSSAYLEGSAGRDGSRILGVGQVKELVWTISCVLEFSSKGDRKGPPHHSKTERTEGLSICADLVSTLIACKSTLAALGKLFRDTTFPGEPNLGLVENLARGIVSGSASRSDVRRSIVSALVQLSTMVELHPHFQNAIVGGGGSSPIGVLLALAKSYKSETVETREIALLALCNALAGVQTGSTSESADGQRDMIFEDICRNNGLGVLSELIVSSSSDVASPAIKDRASAALSLCVSSVGAVSMLNRDADIGRKLRREYERTVSDPLFSSPPASSSSVPSYDPVSHGDIAVNLARILAALEQPRISGDGDGGAVSSSWLLISVLPRPRKDSCGRVTAGSICRPPAPHEVGSALALAVQSASFLGNVLKLLISTLDSPDGRLLDSRERRNQLLERTVCLLANSGLGGRSAEGGLHPSATKNAMIVLAKLVRNSGKRDPGMMQRARELRGMEIMREMGRRAGMV